MAVYRKRSVEKVEAVRWLGNNEEEMDRFLTWAHYYGSRSNDFLVSLFIPTYEGPMEVKPGDWVIETFLGGFRVCKPAVFDATYEEVEG
ncbi:MAG: hypothetical protein GY701_25190 [Sulfitobacter sp.]|nr:hypothetical protein [Sulfitobacter sp.]